LPTPAIELQQYIARARRERVKANRNRPQGKLPAFELRECGTWCVREERESLLQAFEQRITTNLETVCM
jgi:hypothetical protein